MKKHAKNSEEYVRLEAYLLSENAGHPHGMDAIFWAQAEKIVRARLAGLAVPKISSAKNKKKTAAKKPAVEAPAAAKAPAKVKPPEKPVVVAPKATVVKKPVPAKAPAAKKTAAAAAESAPKRKPAGGQGPKSVDSPGPWGPATGRWQGFRRILIALDQFKRSLMASGWPDLYRDIKKRRLSNVCRRPIEAGTNGA